MLYWRFAYGPSTLSLDSEWDSTLLVVVIEDRFMWRHQRTQILLLPFAEKDPVKQMAMRRQGTLAEYFLGSVNAIAETGELVFASGSGSQLPAYAYTSRNVIWVAGAQKLRLTLEDAIRRIREYVLPLEDQRMKSTGNPAGSRINRLLILENEPAYLRRNLTLILVNQALGF
jgi:hypothetical protein